MEPLRKFLGRRYGNAFRFSLPIVIYCVLLGIGANLLDHYSTIAPQTIDGWLIVLMFLPILLAMFVMTSKRTLPSWLGHWQQHWHKIPTWTERHQSKTNQPPPAAK